MPLPRSATVGPYDRLIVAIIDREGTRTPNELVRSLPAVLSLTVDEVSELLLQAEHRGFIEKVSANHGRPIYRATKRGEDLVRTEWTTVSTLLAIGSAGLTILFGLLSIGTTHWLQHHAALRGLTILLSWVALLAGVQMWHRRRFGRRMEPTLARIDDCFAGSKPTARSPGPCVFGPRVSRTQPATFRWMPASAPTTRTSSEASPYPALSYGGVSSKPASRATSRR